MGSVTTMSPPTAPPEHIVFGRSEIMLKLGGKIDRLANTGIPILLVGEDGTGKEVMARVIHRRSRWAAGPFVKVSCPALPESALDVEWFDSGAGASTQQGTLFLDQVGELNLPLQARLLQSLLDGNGCRLGRVEGRLICSSSRELQDEVESGEFRKDLFYRINVLTLRLPSLRDRREDIPDLVVYFLGLYSEKFNCPAKPLSAGALRVLQEYHWPGNIRELENLIKRYVILGSEDAITDEFLRRTRAAVTDIPLNGPVSLKKVARQAAREVERQVILRALQANNWNRKQVARTLSISYRALLYKIRDAGLGPGHRGQHSENDPLPAKPISRLKDVA